MHTTTVIGLRGEEEAAQWLLGQGFSLLHRNWRKGSYELDIVAERRGVLHFVEVKTRRALGLTPPELAIDHSKARSLVRAARAYLAHHPFDGEVQFDLVAVETLSDGPPQVRYIEHAVEPHW